MRICTFGQDGPYSQRPGLDRVGIGYGGLLHLTGYPDRPPVRVGVTISDYLTGVFAAQAADRGAVRRATCTRSGKGAVIDAALYGAALRILEWTIAGLRPARRRAQPRGQPARQLARRSTTTPPRDGKYVCIVAGSDANFARLCKAMERPDLLDDPRFAKLADRAAHGDEINGIVADWTQRSMPATEVEAALRRARRARRDRVHRGRHVRRPALRRAGGDLVTVDDPVVGPMRQQAPYPRVRRRAGRRTRRARPGSASTPTRCCATLLGLDADASSTRCATEGVI